ncbi:TonB-dependent receptor plug domain-containing protein [Enterobacter hormaechei]
MTPPPRKTDRQLRRRPAAQGARSDAGRHGHTNGQDVNLRGSDRRGVLVLVDGVRQGTDTGHLNSTFLDPALIERIEVIVVLPPCYTAAARWAA